MAPIGLAQEKKMTAGLNQMVAFLQKLTSTYLGIGLTIQVIALLLMLTTTTSQSLSAVIRISRYLTLIDF